MATTDHIRMFNALTNRHKEVLRLRCKGLAYKEIGEKLFISTNTVKSHMGKIYETLELIDLEPSQRIAIIHEIYCPILKKSPLALVVFEEETLPRVAPEVQRMVEEDEYSLAVWEPAQIIIEGEVEEIPPEPPKPIIPIGCVWGLIGIIVGGGLLAVFLLIFGGNILGFRTSDPLPVPIEEPAPSPEISVASATPVIKVVTATNLPASATPIPTYTSSPIPMPTKTPVPTQTDTPIAGGIGKWVGNEDLQIKLLDYEFRSINNEVDEGAVNVFLSFINNTNSPVEVEINWYIAEGVDNVGTKYGEIQSVGDRYFSWSKIKEKLENWSMVVPANSIELLDFELHVEGNNSGHISRVDIRTDWIDLKIPSIVYRTGELHQVTGKWRLDR